MEKRDFSLRYEVEVILREHGIEMNDVQIDDVVEAVEEYDTFLGVVGLFVAKGIKEIAERDNISFDSEKIENQMERERKSINYDDL